MEINRLMSLTYEPYGKSYITYTDYDLKESAVEDVPNVVVAVIDLIVERIQRYGITHFITARTSEGDVIVEGVRKEIKDVIFLYIRHTNIKRLKEHFLETKTITK